MMAVSANNLRITLYLTLIAFYLLKRIWQTSIEFLGFLINFQTFTAIYCQIIVWKCDCSFQNARQWLCNSLIVNAIHILQTSNICWYNNKWDLIKIWMFVELRDSFGDYCIGGVSSCFIHPLVVVFTRLRNSSRYY